MRPGCPVGLRFMYDSAKQISDNGEQDVLVIGEALIRGSTTGPAIVSDDRWALPSPTPPDPGSNTSFSEVLRTELQVFASECMRPHLQEMTKLVNDYFEKMRREMLAMRKDGHPEGVSSLMQELRQLLDERQHVGSKQPAGLAPSSAQGRRRQDRVSVDSAAIAMRGGPPVGKAAAASSANAKDLFGGRIMRGNMAMDVFNKYDVVKESNDHSSSKVQKLDDSRIEEKQPPKKTLRRANTNPELSESDKIRETLFPAGLSFVRNEVRNLGANQADQMAFVPHMPLDGQPLQRRRYDSKVSAISSSSVMPTQKSQCPPSRNSELDKHGSESRPLRVLNKAHSRLDFLKKSTDLNEVCEKRRRELHFQAIKRAGTKRLSKDSRSSVGPVASWKPASMALKSGGASASAVMGEAQMSKAASTPVMFQPILSAGRTTGRRSQVFLGKTGAQTAGMDSSDVFSANGSKIRLAIIQCVHSLWFDMSSAILIFFNAVWIGISVDIMSRRGTDYDPPDYFPGLDIFFCVAFTVELALRLYTWGCSFFYAKQWQWNIFDMVLVIMQIIEEFLARIYAENPNSSNYSFMRLLRILRLIRVVRLVRIVRIIGELRTLVTSIISSLKSLSWTIVLLIVMMYMVGIYFAQLISDHGRHDPILCEYFGSLGKSLLTLFEAFTGGVDWHILADALLKSIHPFCAVLFALYIAFAVLAVLNVVTGVFVESALAVTRHDKDVDLVNHLREVFAKTDHDGNGMLEWEEFEKHIEDSQMDVLFKAVDLDRSEARGLFELIDIENKGEISREDFIMGCLRLKGGAKALDLATLMYDNKRLANMLEEHMSVVETFINEVNPHSGCSYSTVLVDSSDLHH